MKVLDLCCGAGGASVGYYLADLADAADIDGVDILKQLNYPFNFIRGEAIEYLEAHWQEYDFVHASPPCKLYTKMGKCRPELADTYVDMITPLREVLDRTGLPYIIENVPGSPMRADIELCGTMFGYDLYRHRWFEANWPMKAPDHPVHVKPASKAGQWRPGTVMSLAGHFAPLWKAQEIMQMDWTNGEELAQAIPPYYTKYIGQLFLDYLRSIDE